jgi:SnoaL-like protein
MTLRVMDEAKSIGLNFHQICLEPAMPDMNLNPIAAWHELIAGGNPQGLDSLLDDEVVFHSPVVFKPQEGKALTSMYLHAAFNVLINNSFHYVREVVGEHDAVLEFVVTIDDIEINGVDMIRWNDHGRIIDFKVMVRPLKGMEMIRQKMAAMLESLPG